MATDQVNMSVAQTGTSSGAMIPEEPICTFTARKELIETVVKIARVAEEDVDMFINPEGIRLERLSNDREKMIKIYIPDYNVYWFRVRAEGKYNLNLKYLASVLRAIPKDAEIEIEIYDIKMVIKFEGSKYEIPLFKTDAEPLKDPKALLKASIAVPAKEVKRALRIIKDYKYVPFEITIKVSNYRPYMIYSSEVINSEIELPYEDCHSDTPEDVSSKFDATYIRNIFDVLGSLRDMIVLMEIGDNTPIKISYANDFEMEYWIAPRVDK